MSLLLIDTDVASFIFKGSNYVNFYLPILKGHELALSFMNVKDFQEILNLQLITSSTQS